MTAPLAIGIVGDRVPDFPYHTATEDALDHAATALALPLSPTWIPTESLSGATIFESRLRSFDAFWCAPGDYQSPAGALAAIQWARQHRIPFIGTCGGFQHALLEYARHVVHIVGADHEEYAPGGLELVISKLGCSLAGKSEQVQITSNSRAHTIYGCRAVVEQFVCRYGLNPDYRDRMTDGRLCVSGTDRMGDVRIVELADHPFFMATLFQPQLASRPEAPHPLIVAFLEAAADADHRDMPPATTAAVSGGTLKRGKNSTIE